MRDRTNNYAISESRTAFLIIAVVLLLHGYLFADYFGIYEDDYIWMLTLPPMGWSFQDFCHTLGEIWSHWIIYQGRPLSFSFNAIIAYVSGKAPSLGFGYAIGYLILLLNGCLLFKVLRNVLPFAGALVGTLAYVTFVPDVAGVILMHRMLHLSMTFLMIAILLYQRSSYFLAYIVATLTLFTYESFYLPFLIAPVLRRDFRKRPLRTFLFHCLLFFGIAGVVVIVRSSQGDERSGMITGSLFNNLSRILEACLFGLWTCLRSSFYDVFARSIAGSTSITLITAACGAIIIGLLSWHKLMGNVRHRFLRKAPLLLCRYGWIVSGGMLAVAFSYCLSFRANYFPPTMTQGRLSFVHLSAGFGWSVAFGTIFTCVYDVFSSKRRWLWVATLCYFGFLINYGLVIQQTDYVANWRQQERLWKELISFSGNFEDDEIILLDMETVPGTPGFYRWGSFGTKAFDALRFFLQFPKEWKKPPRVFGLDDSTDTDVRSDGVCIHTPYWISDIWPIIRDGNFIYFRVVNGELRALDEPKTVHGRTLVPKHVDPLRPEKYKVTSIYRKVFRND
jgi:hypothetical protein